MKVRNLTHDTKVESGIQKEGKMRQKGRNIRGRERRKR